MTILPAHRARARWDDETAEAWIGETFTWTDRASYLAWVSAWKAELVGAISAIRQAKAVRRDSTADDATRGAAQSERHYLRIVCANLFLLRRLAKQLSARQKRERLAAA